MRTANPELTMGLIYSSLWRTMLLILIIAVCKTTADTLGLGGTAVEMILLQTLIKVYLLLIPLALFAFVVLMILSRHIRVALPALTIVLILIVLSLRPW